MATNYDSPEVKRKKAPTMFIELVDQRDSGWVMDGTLGTKNEVRMTSPSAEFIPNRGYRLIKIKNENGDEEWVNQAIRYIKNCPILPIEEQEKRGFKPAKNKMEDLIIVKGGKAAITREGSMTSLYDYLTEVFYNESNEKASKSAKKIFRVVDYEKKHEFINERELAAAEAISYLGSLCQRSGAGFDYNEPKIDALCNLFLVFAESPSGKLNALIAHAKANPIGFLDRALRFEQTIEMEIGHALDLNVIKFDGNTAVYVHKDKVIAEIGRGNIKHEKKVQKLAEMIGSDEYKGALTELRMELEAAKAKK